MEKLNTSYELRVRSSNPRNTPSNQRVMFSNLQRLNARVARLKVRARRD